MASTYAGYRRRDEPYVTWTRKRSLRKGNTHDVRNGKGRAMLRDAFDIVKGPLQQGGSWAPALSIQWSTGGGQEMGSGLQPFDDRLDRITNTRHVVVKTGCIRRRKMLGQEGIMFAWKSNDIYTKELIADPEDGRSLALWCKSSLPHGIALARSIS